MKNPSAALVVLLCLNGAFLTTGCSSGGSSAGTPTPTPTPTPAAAAPTVSTIAPATIPVGSPTATITVTGTGFLASTVIQVGATAETTSLVSSTQVTAVVPAAQLSIGALLPVVAVNGVLTSASTPAVNLEIDNPAPAITSFAPAAFTLGAAPVPVTVTGTGFTSTTTIQVGPLPRPTTYVSATQVTVMLTGADLGTAGKLSLTAVNAAPGGGSSPVASLAVNNPVPAISLLAPSSLVAGSPASTDVVSGTGFLPSTVVQINGSARTTSFMSATQLTVSLTAADVATAGALSLTAVNAAPGGGTSAAASLPVNNPVPAITLLAPSSLLAGSPAITEVVSGTGFLPSTVLQLNGAARTTTFVSATQLSVALTAADLATAGSVGIIAANAAPGGGSSAAASAAVNNPAPGTIVLNPTSVLAATAAATTVTVTGTNFVPASVVQLNGTAQPTTYVSSTQLTFALTIAQQATAAVFSITVVAPAPGGGTSAAAAFSVNNPVPGTLTLSPSSAAAGLGPSGMRSLFVSVTGINLNASSVIYVNGLPRYTSYYSGPSLGLYLTSSDLLLTGSLSFTVANGTPGGGTSQAATFTVGPVTTAPAISSVSPYSLYAGSATTTLTVYGNYLGANSVVLCNGTALTTVFNSSTYSTSLTATLPASFLTATGNLAITVNTPTATPSLSNSYSLPVNPQPVPTLTSLSATSGPMNAPTSIYVNGTNFTAGSTVAYNGITVPTTYNSTSYSLMATLSPAAIALPGTGLITVTNPSPGGGTTAGLPYTAYIGIANNSMVYNPVNGLFYVSVPSSAGAPYGNAVVSVDPATGAFGKPIFVGSEPNKLAITSDGKYLWVGLDGASSVRKVDLVAGTAGLQFGLGSSSSSYYATTAGALAALPGATDSVVVAPINGANSVGLAIYDAGTARSTTVSTGTSGTVYALLVDGTKNEVYAAGYNYTTYIYNASGLTLKTGPSSGPSASSSFDDLQIAGGILYTDNGKAYAPETGALAGTFYTSGSTVATGTTVADPTLGRLFVLDNSALYSYQTYNQIQIFNTADYNPTSSSVIPISVTIPYSSGVVSTGPSRMTRWGTNGLALRTSAGVYSVRSNLVKDLSTTSADLAVSLTATGVATGANTTYTATVTNNGPSAATNVVVTAMLPSTGTLVSVTPSVGSCSPAVLIACDLGSLANGATPTITFVVLENSAGTATMTVQVGGSENDPTPSNNQAASTSTIAGSTYSPVPVLNTISPASILAGSSDTTLTVTGTGFSSTSQIQAGSTALSTTMISSTQLSALIPQATLATIGWKPISVTTPALGGGTSQSLALSIYGVIKLGVNHIVYDPYSRQIMASVGTSGTSTVTGNSIVPITPETATLGTPVPIGSQPTQMALTADGQILYTVLTGSNSVARMNMLTQKLDFAAPIAAPANSYYTLALVTVAAQPGTENTIALELGGYLGSQIFDFDPVTKTAAGRTQTSSAYSGSCLQFLDATDLFQTNGTYVYRFPVTSTGYGTVTASALYNFNCFKLDGGLAFTSTGRVATALPAAISPATSTVPIGSFPLTTNYYSGIEGFAGDASLQRAFFLTSATSNSSYPDGVIAYDNNTFLASNAASLNMSATEGNTFYTGVDLIRWGQDGVAALTSGGHIYLLRGPAVVPQLLNANSAATLTSSSSTTLAHGTGNTLLTLTGSGFLPGVAVTWNGSYRTTTIVDATHVTVAIPASDLAAAGSAALLATNPGAAASATITVTVN